MRRQQPAAAPWTGLLHTQGAIRAGLRRAQGGIEAARGRLNQHRRGTRAWLRELA